MSLTIPQGIDRGPQGIDRGPQVYRVILKVMEWERIRALIRLREVTPPPVTLTLPLGNPEEH